MKELVSIAEKNAPAIVAKTEQSKAAAQDIKIQKNTIVPSLDAAYQANYATYNNITGMAYPAYLVPISGPPSSSNHYSGVFGSAAALLLSWQPFTFGQREAQTAVAQQNYQLSLADENNTRYQQALQVMAAYLNLVMAGELEKVYNENISRIHIQLKQMKSLVSSGIRPGVDTSLYQSELSKATIDLYHIQEYAQQQLLNIGQLTGSPLIAVKQDTTLAQRLPSLGLQDSATLHPRVQYQQQFIKRQQADETVIHKSLLPRLNIWSTAYARGSGIQYDGTVKSTDGLGFSRYNYGLGIQLSMPLLKFTDVRLQLQKQHALIKNAEAGLQATQLQVLHDSLTAALSLTQSIKIAQETPVQLTAANIAYRSLLSRYNAGLASFADLMQAQYALVKAETDVKQAYIGAWKALLQIAAAKGNINLFLNQVN